MPTLPAVAILYDHGSAGPVEIYRAARGLCRLVWVVDRTTDLAGQAAALDTTGDVIAYDGVLTPDVPAALARLPVAGVTTFADSRVLATARLAATLGLRYHSVDTGVRLTDKVAQRRALRDSGVDPTRFLPVVPGHGLPPGLDPALFPAILKPAVGHGSIDTYLVPHERALAERLAALSRRRPGDQFILETYHRDSARPVDLDRASYVSVESCSLDGVTRNLFVSGKFAQRDDFLETGSFVPSDIAPELDSDVRDLASAALDALETTWGVTHTEIKLTGDGGRIIEVNGRLGGEVNTMTRCLAGVDLITVALRISLGQDPLVPGTGAPGVAFEYGFPAPRGTTRVAGIEGVREARRLPGVRRVDVRRPAGSRLVWLDPHRTYTVALSGLVADHAGLQQLIEQINSRIRIDYQIDAGPSGASGAAGAAGSDTMKEQADDGWITRPDLRSGP